MVVGVLGGKGGGRCGVRGCGAGWGWVDGDKNIKYICECRVLVRGHEHLNVFVSVVPCLWPFVTPRTRGRVRDRDPRDIDRFEPLRLRDSLDTDSYDRVGDLI